MDYNHDQYAYYPVTIFVSIIGTAATHRYMAAALNRRYALDDLITYLNAMMAEEVVPQGAGEEEVFKAIADNLFEPTEIVECYADNLFGPSNITEPK